MRELKVILISLVFLSGFASSWSLASGSCSSLLLGYVEPKDQDCVGLCWAYAATAAMENEGLQITGDSIPFSVSFTVGNRLNQHAETSILPTAEQRRYFKQTLNVEEGDDKAFAIGHMITSGIVPRHARLLNGQPVNMDLKRYREPGFRQLVLKQSQRLNQKGFVYLGKKWHPMEFLTHIFGDDNTVLGVFYPDEKIDELDFSEDGIHRREVQLIDKELKRIKLRNPDVSEERMVAAITKHYLPWARDLSRQRPIPRRLSFDLPRLNLLEIRRPIAQIEGWIVNEINRRHYPLISHYIDPEFYNDKTKSFESPSRLSLAEVASRKNTLPMHAQVIIGTLFDNNQKLLGFWLQNSWDSSPMVRPTFMDAEYFRAYLSSIASIRFGANNFF